MLDFGDAPDGITGYNYRTVLATDGARHIINSTIFLGDKIDAEGDGQPTLGADGDDLNLSDDEDGLFLPVKVYPGGMAIIGVKASIDGFLDVWMDFNLNGNWGDPGEHVFASQAVLAGMNSLSFTVPTSASYGVSYIRFRFRDNPAPISYFGLVQNGEVEDYNLLIDEEQPQELDFCDAPDSIPGFNYHTQMVNNGARHIIDPDVFLGNLIDAEADGQPTINALGDDLNNLDDEDGVRIRRAMSVGGIAAISVKASVAGYLNAWVHFDRNGSWAEAGNQIFTDEPLLPGWNTLTFGVPADAKKGRTYARFRFNTSGGLTFEGLADDGEVEDYRVPIFPENWAYTVTDLSHMIAVPLSLSQLLMNGESFMFMSDDIIGAFYGIRAGSACGGAIPWDGTENQVLMAFGNDPLTNEKDGFDEGENFGFKVYRPATGETFDVEATFDPAMPNSDGKFHNNGMSAFTGLNLAVISQTLAIPEGWSGISTYLEPLDTGIENMFSPIVDDLVILYNEDGMYWPGENTNSLGQWNAHKGYVIKMANDATLDFAGEELMDVSVDLAAGWNIVPVLSAEPFDIGMLFDQLAGFVAAKEVAGIGVYLPGYGINTIGNMMPGNAYYAYTSEAGSVSFILLETKSTIEFTAPIEPVSPWNVVNHAPGSHIVVFNLTDSPLMPGDVIGAFTSDDLCAGLIEVTDGKFAMTINGDDSYTESKTGFADGEALNYKLYRPSTDETLDLETNYNPDMTPGVFTLNGLSEVVELKTSATGLADADEMDIRIYPNPSNGVFNITGTKGSVEITVVDIFGKEILHSNFDILNKIDLTGKPEGIYFVKIKTRDGFESTRKLIVH